MNVANAPDTDRMRKNVLRVSARMDEETARELAALRGRPEHLPGYDYFLELLEGGITPEALERRTGRAALNLICVQAPLELIHAAGFMPFKLFCGSFAAETMGASGTLPALMCPMLRALQGAMRIDDPTAGRPWVLPTTCDWIVQLPAMLNREKGVSDTALHWMELPHLKDSATGRERWLAEIFALKAFLEKSGGAKIARKSLSASVALYNRAWQALCRLEELRVQERVPLVWFLVITGAFFLDAPERWTGAVNALLPELAGCHAGQTGASGRGRVFLAGSPIFFPNFKLPRLLEESGLAVTGDDLCSSGRILAGGALPEATSEYDLLALLASRYHEGCLCPTFADNDRRLHNILARAAEFSGVVFHVLKGCHPYDLESCLLEERIRRQGLKFLRLETDYAAEDSRNLLTRLEAFGQTL